MNQREFIEIILEECHKLQTDGSKNLSNDNTKNFITTILKRVKHDGITRSLGGNNGGILYLEKGGLEREIIFYRKYDLNGSRKVLAIWN